MKRGRGLEVTLGRGFIVTLGGGFTATFIVILGRGLFCSGSGFMVILGRGLFCSGSGFMVTLGRGLFCSRSGFMVTFTAGFGDEEDESDEEEESDEESTSDVMKHCYLLLLSQSDSRMVKYCVFTEFVIVLNANQKHKNSKFF